MGTLQEFEDNRIANRSKVSVVIGKFVLTLDPEWMIFNVTTKDGSPVPKGLDGRWTHTWMFRRAAERLLGPEYSIEGLSNSSDKLKNDALSVGVDLNAVRLDDPKSGGRNG